MSCNDVLPLLSPYIDGELSRHDRLAVEAHLAICPSCAAALVTLRDNLALVRSLPELEVPDDFSIRLTEKIHREKLRLRRTGLRRTLTGLAAAVIFLVSFTLATSMFYNGLHYSVAENTLSKVIPTVEEGNSSLPATPQKETIQTHPAEAANSPAAKRELEEGVASSRSTGTSPGRNTGVIPGELPGGSTAGAAGTSSGGNSGGLPDRDITASQPASPLEGAEPGQRVGAVAFNKEPDSSSTQGLAPESHTDFRSMLSEQAKSSSTTTGSQGAEVHERKPATLNDSQKVSFNVQVSPSDSSEAAAGKVPAQGSQTKTEPLTPTGDVSPQARISAYAEAREGMVMPNGEMGTTPRAYAPMPEADGQGALKKEAGTSPGGNQGGIEGQVPAGSAGQKPAGDSGSTQEDRFKKRPSSLMDSRFYIWPWWAYPLGWAGLGLISGIWLFRIIRFR